MLKHIRTFSFVLICIALALFLLLSVILAIYVGAVELTPQWIFQILTNHITGQQVFPQTPKAGRDMQTVSSGECGCRRFWLLPVLVPDLTLWAL